MTKITFFTAEVQLVSSSGDRWCRCEGFSKNERHRKGPRITECKLPWLIRLVDRPRQAATCARARRSAAPGSRALEPHVYAHSSQHATGGVSATQGSHLAHALWWLRRHPALRRLPTAIIAASGLARAVLDACELERVVLMVGARARARAWSRGPRAARPVRPTA